MGDEGVVTMPRVPPGRSGRMWLTHRLAVASRAAELLDQKVRVLRQETERYALLAERTEADWARSCLEAEDWALRAVLVGGQAALRAAADHEPAEAALTWETTMGVSHPAQARCRLPVTTADDTLGPATVAAVTAYRHALEAAVAHAAAVAALRAVEAELAATRHRLRAVTDRWMPRLEEALAAMVLSLEETERAEGVGLRWALRATQQRDPSP
ncbi:MAG: V-type ATP synthase subunit D [Actinomycetes bacterium]